MVGSIPTWRGVAAPDERTERRRPQLNTAMKLVHQSRHAVFLAGTTGRL